MQGLDIMPDKERNVSKSIQAEPLTRPVVRWLGAYGTCGQIDQSSPVWEIDPNRPVSAEVVGPSGFSAILRVDQSSIGLLVDISKTKLLRCWSGDAYTPRDYDLAGDSYVPANNYSLSANTIKRGKGNKLRYVDSWDKVQGLRPNKASWYCEALIERPVYLAVVVRCDTDDRVMGKAKEVAVMMGLPIVTVENLGLHCKNVDPQSYKQEHCLICKGQASRRQIVHRKWCSHARLAVCNGFLQFRGKINCNRPM